MYNRPIAMRRRSFFRWMAAAATLARLPRWARAQSPPLAPGDVRTLNALAAVVLPASLGRAQTDAVAAQFLAWCANYREHADLGYGYGHPRTRFSGPNPARSYAAQLRALGPDFTLAALAAQRAAIEAALAQAGVTRLPARPNGQHVASDLIGFYFNGAAGEDFLFQARVMRDACRGLEGSENRPAPIQS